MLFKKPGEQLLKVFTLFWIISMLFAFSSISHAQTTSWTGNVNNDWDDTANWSNGVPVGGGTANINPQGGNPPPVLSQSTTIGTLNLSENFGGGDLTITSGATLTITGTLNVNGNGSLFIESNAGVDVQGQFEMAFNNALIDIETGRFSAANEVEIRGSAFNAGSGTVNFGSDFTVANNKAFNAEDATVTVDGVATINGTYNGGGASTTFNDELFVHRGVLNLGSGSITTNERAEISNNGTLNLGSGTMNVNDDLVAQSNGNINVQNATLNITGNAAFQNNGNLSVDNGTIDVKGDASLQNGGSFDLNSGNLDIGGNASFTSGGTVNAGTSNISVNGDFTVDNESNFQAGSSSVSFSGMNQQVNGDVEFYNVTVDSGSTVSSNGDITVTNDLNVSETGAVNIQNDDQLEVQGDFNNKGDVNNQRPFVTLTTTPDFMTVAVEFDKDLDPTTAENAGNYAINNGITISAANLDPGDASIVNLTVSTLTDGAQYTLTVDNLEDTQGNSIKNGYMKKFTVAVQVTYYSLNDGNWNTASTWSTQSHNGAVAFSPPTANSAVEVGNGDEVSITSLVTVSDFESIEVKLNSTLNISQNGIFETETEVITGDGTFKVSNGELRIGSVEGISSSGILGNIQTANRAFGSAGGYTYNGTNAQVTGSALPQTVGNLTINNASNVEANKNIRVSNTLILKAGALIIPSGQNLIANTKSITNGSLIFRREINSGTGWRQLSSPVDSDYDDLFDAIVTQGYDGAFYDASVAPNDSLQPNILYYDETSPGTDNQRYRAPGSAATSLTAGRGLFTYVFGDIPNDSRYTKTLPSTLEVQGQEFEGSGNSINLDVTYTAAADTGFNFVGNPYGAAIDWDDPSWTKTNIDNTIYVYDASSNTYLTWNGTTGGLNSGIVSSFQGFWIKANAPNPSLVVDEEAKTFGNTFVGKANGASNSIPKIELRISDGKNSSSTYLQFDEQARLGKDINDAFNLLPPLGVATYTNIYSLSQEGDPFSINNLPRKFGRPIEIPITVEAFENGFTDGDMFTFSSPMLENIPPGWKIILRDSKTNRKTILSQRNEYQFSLGGKKVKAPGYPHANATVPKPINPVDARVGAASSAKKKRTSARFTLIIEPGSDAGQLPQSVKLFQNFPNPFHSTTTVKFSLPVQTQTSITIYNVLGRKIESLIGKELAAGTHTVKWNANRYASGVYLFVLKTDEKILSKKLTYIK